MWRAGWGQVSGEWDEQQKIGWCIEDRQGSNVRKRINERDIDIIVGANVNVINNMYLRHTTAITKRLRSELL